MSQTENCSKCSAHLFLVINAEGEKKEEIKAALPEVIHLEKRTILLGRQSSKVDVPISSKAFPCLISRIHARLERDDEDETEIQSKWILKDMNSLNGVLVNNIVIKEHILEEDDVCMLGGKQESHVGDKIDKPQTDVIYKFKYNPEYSLLGKRLRSSSELLPNGKKPAITIDLESQETERELMKKKDEELTKKEKELLEKEEAMKKAEESFHQEIANYQSQLLNKDEENQQLKTLVEKNVEKKQNSEPSWEDDVCCVVCLELFLEPYTLPCSHTLCGDCLEKWTTMKLQCPACRVPINSEPVYSRTVNNLVLKIVATLTDEQKKEFEERKKEKEKSENSKILILNQMIQRAIQGRARFLNIKNRWSAAEQNIFAKGVSAYTGKVRAVYCSTTGLTENWVRSANLAQLRLASINCKIEANEQLGRKYNDIRDYYREILIKFITKRFSKL